MIRSELVRQLAQTHPHLSPLLVEAVIDRILNEITDSLARGQRVEFRGFGSFTSKIRDERIGRNPKTGEAIQVETKQVAVFRASQQLLTRLNSESQG